MQISVNKTIKIGIIGGIICMIIFGIIMQMIGKIAMIAGIMGSSSLLSGWIIHMMISIIFGITFGLLTSVIKNRLVLTSHNCFWGWNLDSGSSCNHAYNDGDGNKPFKCFCSSAINDLRNSFVFLYNSCNCV